MPYIDFKLSAKLVDKKEETLKFETAQLMKKIAGKDEPWLYIRFNTHQTLYFRGDPLKNGALVEIKLVGSLSSAQKRELSAAMGKLLENELGVHPDELYLIITEVKGENWGWNGQTFG
jgi:phenylpyruvate tautomerase PptA (4-oxalocrotonate tautomerase family)